MTVVHKHPTAYTNDPTRPWQSPENALGEEDNSCARRNLLNGQSSTLYLSGFGFSIPAGSTINHVRIYGKGLEYNNYYVTGIVMYIELAKSPNYMAEYLPLWAATKACSDTVYVGGNYDAKDWLSVNDLNNENFTFRCYGSVMVSVAAVFILDAVYVEVDYTPPSVGAGRLADGFVCVSS